jgi:transketolase
MPEPPVPESSVSQSSVSQSSVHEPPYRTELKPYGRALVDLARRRGEVLCLSGDLTRQCEVDLFQDELPDRFIHGGMAEANMMGMAGALARCGHIPFVHTFGVFATRRPFDQIANAIAYPGLPVRIIGFMPGVSTPGGPSHQATDDVALMRALPGMTVVDVADAVEVRQVVEAVVDVPGPVYVRLKRGEIPVIFDEGHVLRLGQAEVVVPGHDVALFASGMMLAAALAAARKLAERAVSVSVINVPTIKPLDTATVLDAAAAAQIVVTAENHSIIGGLGSAVAETIAEAGLGRPLRRVGLRDTFAEGSSTAPYLFSKYGLSTQALIETIWSALGRPGPAPEAPPAIAETGEYAPV